VGFWGLAFFYPLNGIHHFLYSPIPMYLQYGAILSTIAVEFVVTTVVINFLGTLWGRGEMLRENMPIRWFYVGIVFYFLTCLQCSFQTTLTFQKIIHFTDWVVGHAHMVMFGVFGFWILGIITYLWPKLTGSPWAYPKLLGWHFWLSSISLAVMVADLTIAGLIQGFMWAALAPWIDVVNASKPFWLVRTISGVGIIVGQILFAWNMIATWNLGRARGFLPLEEGSDA
jgi:cytochrome c oxidase cbb3-type subunit 1